MKLTLRRGSLRLTGTPTLMMVSRGGVVKSTWVGLLSQVESDRLLAMLN
jgi:hypothetical protein